MNIVLCRFSHFISPPRETEEVNSAQKKLVSIETMTITTATCDDDDNEDIHVDRSIVNKTIFFNLNGVIFF